MESYINRKVIDIVAQGCLSVLSLVAIVLVSRKNKWGFVFGFSSQPFWIATSLINRQWGVFFLSVVYTFTWGYGIYEWFFKERGAIK